MPREFLPALYHAKNEEIAALLSTHNHLSNEFLENGVGWRPIHLCAVLGYFDTLRLLLEGGADPTLQDKLGWTAGHHAVAHGHVECLALLLEHGLSVSALTKAHESLIFFTTKYKKKEILKKLLHKKANPSVVSYSGQSALREAAMAEDYNILGTLLQSLDHFSEAAKRHLLQELFGIQKILSLHLLLNSGSSHKNFLANIPANAVECQSNYGHLLQTLSSNNVDVPMLSLFFSQGLRPHEILVMLDSLLLFKTKMQAHAEYSTLIDEVVGQVNLAFRSEEELLQAIFVLCRHAVDIATLICKSNRMDFLHLFRFIAMQDRADALANFLEKHGDGGLDVIDEKGQGIYQFLVEHNAIQSLSFLFSHRPIAAEQAKEFICYAAVNGHANLLLDLIQQHRMYKKESIDNNLNTALHLSVLNGHTNCVTDLLSLGVDTKSRNKEEKTALDLAQEKKNRHMMQLLSEVEKSPIKTLVFEGGGVKGIAYPSALKELIDHRVINLNTIEMVAGSSAGAIVSLLLALSYSIEEIDGILKEIDFYNLIERNLVEHRDLKKEFFDIVASLQAHNGLQNILGKDLYKFFLRAQSGGLNLQTLKPYIASFAVKELGVVSEILQGLGIHDQDYQGLMSDINRLKEKVEPFFRLLDTHRGIFSGEILRKQFVKWIKAKGLPAYLTFAQLHELTQSDKKYKDLYVSVYDVSRLCTQVISYENDAYSNVVIADAVRCSMGIQLFFQPHQLYVSNHGVDRVPHQAKGFYFDGGSLDNYLLSYFDKKKYVIPGYLGDEAITNSYALGFRLLEAPKAQTPDKSRSMIEFLKDVIYSVFVFTKQESDFRNRPDLISRTVGIHTGDITAIEFNISPERKQSLIISGQQAAIEFSNKRTAAATAKKQRVKGHFLLAQGEKDEDGEEGFFVGRYESSSGHVSDAPAAVVSRRLPSAADVFDSPIMGLRRNSSLDARAPDNTASPSSGRA